MFIRQSRAKCIRSHNNLKQVNTRCDADTLSKLQDLKAFYTDLTGQKVKTGVVIRRAVHLLMDHIKGLSEQNQQDKNEARILKQCADGRRGKA